MCLKKIILFSISKKVTYQNDETIFLIPHEFNEFGGKYIDIDYVTSPYYSGYYFKISKKDLLKYCKIVEE